MTVSAPQLGKTLVGILWLVSAAFMGGKSVQPWWWCSPTFDMGTHALRLMADVARTSNILARPPVLSSPSRIELVNGAIIEFRSWHDPEHMYGPTIRGAVVDEFGRLTKEAYSALSSRRAETISRGEGRVRYLGNTGVVGGEAENIWNRATAGEPGFAARRWTWRDRALAHACPCGLAPDFNTAGKHRDACARGIYCGFIDRERSRMSDPQFRMLYEAEFLDWNDLPAYLYDRTQHQSEAAAFNPHLDLDLACDFNVDPMAWVVGQHKGSEAWAFDELIVPGGATTAAVAEEFVRRYGNRRCAVNVYGDASGRARSTKSKHSDYKILRTRLRKAFHTVNMCVPTSNPPVTARLNAFNAKLMAADGSVSYQHHPRCVGLSRDLARVALRTGTRDLDKNTDKSLTHPSDADGYRITYLYPATDTAPAATPGREESISYADEILDADF